MSLRNYDIKEVKIIIGGVPIGEGLVSLEVAPMGVAFDSEIGADGMVTRYATHETRSKVNLILKGASPEHQKLSAIHAADVASATGAGILVLSVTDLQGASIALTDKAWIDAMPSKTFGSAPQDVTWVLTAVFDAPLAFVVGGN